MYKTLKLGVAVTLALAVQPASGEIARIVGHGATTCTHFLRDNQRDPNAERVYFTWAQGYMSAILISRPAGVDENLNLTPAQFPPISQMSFVRDYCAEHPQENYSDAIEALYRHLRSMEVKGSAPHE